MQSALALDPTCAVPQLTMSSNKTIKTSMLVPAAKVFRQQGELFMTIRVSVVPGDVRMASH